MAAQDDQNVTSQSSSDNNETKELAHNCSITDNVEQTDYKCSNDNNKTKELAHNCSITDNVEQTDYKCSNDNNKTKELAHKCSITDNVDQTDYKCSNDNNETKELAHNCSNTDNVEQTDYKCSNDNNKTKELAHKCSITDHVEQTDYKCSICDKLFASICTLHDHMFSCFHSGSYIFLHHNRTAYPLSKFCSLYGNRNKLQDVCRDSCDISDKAKTVDIAADVSCDCLENLLQAVEEEGNKSTNIDSGTLKETMCESKSKKKVKKVKTPCLETKSSNEQLKQDVKNKKTLRVYLEKNDDIEIKAKNLIKELSIEEQHRIPSTEKEKRPFRKATKRNHSTRDCEEENITENGTATIQTELDSDSNWEPCLEYGKKRRRPRKKIIAASTIVVGEIRLGPENNHDKPSSNLGKETEQPRKIKVMPIDKNVKRRCRSIIPCEICGKDIRSDTLEKHMASHSDQRPFACDQCPKAYKTKVYLRQHMKSHNEVLPLYCEVCGAGFVELGSLRQHLMRHRNERPFSCNYCEARFVGKGGLNRHMTLHTGKKHQQCDQCGQNFSRKDYLQTHINLIHKRELRFQCSECDQKFFTNYDLKCHTMRHAGVRPNKCKVCSAAFIQRKELRRHMKIKHNLTLETNDTDSDVKDRDPIDSSTETASAIANISNQSRVVQLESVPQSTSAAILSDCASTSVLDAIVNQSDSATSYDKQGTSQNCSEQLQPCDQSMIIIKTEVSESCETGVESESVQFQICPSDNQSRDVAYFGSEVGSQHIETEVFNQEDLTLI